MLAGGSAGAYTHRGTRNVEMRIEATAVVTTAVGVLVDVDDGDSKFGWWSLRTLPTETQDPHLHLFSRLVPSVII